MSLESFVGDTCPQYVHNLIQLLGQPHTLTIGYYVHCYALVRPHHISYHVMSCHAMSCHAEQVEIDVECGMSSHRVCHAMMR